MFHDDCLRTKRPWQNPPRSFLEMLKATPVNFFKSTRRMTLTWQWRPGYACLLTNTDSPQTADHKFSHRNRPRRRPELLYVKVMQKKKSRLPQTQFQSLLQRVGDEGEEQGGGEEEHVAQQRKPHESVQQQRKHPRQPSKQRKEQASKRQTTRILSRMRENQQMRRQNKQQRMRSQNKQQRMRTQNKQQRMRTQNQQQRMRTQNKQGVRMQRGMSSKRRFPCLQS